MVCPSPPQPVNVIRAENVNSHQRDNEGTGDTV